MLLCLEPDGVTNEYPGFVFIVLRSLMIVAGMT